MVSACRSPPTGRGAGYQSRSRQAVSCAGSSPNADQATLSNDSPDAPAARASRGTRYQAVSEGGVENDSATAEATIPTSSASGEGENGSRSKPSEVLDAVRKDPATQRLYPRVSSERGDCRSASDRRRALQPRDCRVPLGRARACAESLYRRREHCDPLQNPSPRGRHGSRSCRVPRVRRRRPSTQRPCDPVRTASPLNGQNKTRSDASTRRRARADPWGVRIAGLAVQRRPIL
jgi:hypothetical protein